ncbi:hypothetical protein [Limnohabitans sp. DM1]|uniref:hypothetical protein n=1 Tax=Limnohabitans sp. DM1 TaxID=1597955 RepID=UPI000B0E6306|nr:hypothetical protein [Limnohabitans sp. DM1]
MVQKTMPRNRLVRMKKVCALWLGGDFTFKRQIDASQQCGFKVVVSFYLTQLHGVNPEVAKKVNKKIQKK